MREVSSNDVPWGRPVVREIPLPPFRTVEDHQRYVRALQLHVSMLDIAEPTPATIALLAVLDQQAPPRVSAVVPHLTPVALQVSLTTFFPAPWTPAALARELAATGGQRFDPTSNGHGWRWGGDPDYSAEPHPEGWLVERFERGSRESATLPVDDLVLLWMDHLRNRFPFPIAHRFDEGLAARLAPATRAVRRTHDVDAAMPYLTNWRRDRDRTMGTARRDHEP